MPVEEDGLTVSVSMAEIRSGEYRLVYAHSEAFLSAQQSQALLRSKLYRENLCCTAMRPT